MENKPELSEIVVYMRKDFNEFISRDNMEPKEAFSRLLEEYNLVEKMGLEYEKISIITAISLALENGFNYLKLEKHYMELLEK